MRHFWLSLAIAGAAMAEPITWEVPIETLRTRMRSSNYTQSTVDWQLADIEADRANAEATKGLETKLEALNVWTATLQMTIAANTQAIEQMAASIQGLSEAVSAAGIAQSNQRIKRAAIALEDVVAIFSQGWTTTGAGTANINTSEWSQLMKVPGIGMTVAMEIVAGRPYQAVADLIRLPSVEQELLDQIAPYLTVTP